MKIYFAGAISGGRSKVNDYHKMIYHLNRYGRVLTEHVGNKKLKADGEANIKDSKIFKRDVKWLKSSDILIAEVSIRSLGVGYEIGLADTLGKRILCLYDNKIGNGVSPMIKGNENLTIKGYKDINHALRIIDSFMKSR